MGENEREYPLEFQPQCPHLNWLCDHLDGWQFGEQGLIEELFAWLCGGRGFIIEYGAGDGESLPLTIDRLYEIGRDCWLVEIDVSRRESLKARYPEASIEKTIDWKAVAKSGQCVDLVVIDIDGCDSVVMREMFAAGVRPMLLVVEHMDRHFPIATSIPDPIPRWMLGLKLESDYTIQDTAETLHAMAAKHGYERIGFNRCNSFFVVSERYTDLFRA